MSSSASVDALAGELARRLLAGERPADGGLQRLLAAVVRSYAERREAGGALPAWSPADAVPATEVVVTVMALLEAADVAVFELGMWQALGRG